MDHLKFALIIILATYPLWFIPAFCAVCISFSTYDHLHIRVAKALALSFIATLLFTPVGWGTDGFGWFVPWAVTLFDPEHTVFYGPGLPIFLLVAGVFISMVASQIRRPTKESIRTHRELKKTEK